MSQNYLIGEINPTTTSPLTDITKLTNAHDAHRSLFSGPSSPQETVPYMFWADTTDGILKRRSADNSTWVFALSLTDSFIKEIKTTYTTKVTDTGTMLLVDASATAITINLLASNLARAGSVISIKKIDNTTNKVIISPNASETIDGDTDYQLQVEHGEISLRADGDNWRIVTLYLPKVVLTKTAAYVVIDADDTAVINVNIATSTVTLPVITTVHNGFSVTIKKLIAGTTTIVPNGTTIDGSVANKLLTAVNQATTLISNGLAWFVTNEANVPIIFPASAYASIGQMQANSVGDIAVTPSVIYASRTSIQCAARFHTTNPSILFVHGCTITQLSGLGKVRINFNVTYRSINSYSATGNAISSVPLTTVGTMAGAFVTFVNYLATSVDCQIIIVAIDTVNGATQLRIGESRDVNIQICGLTAVP